MNMAQAENVLRERVDQFWHDRALDMFRYMVTSTDTVESIRVAKGWPRRGSIRFTIVGKGRVTMYLQGKKFRAKYLTRG